MKCTFKSEVYELLYVPVADKATKLPLAFVDQCDRKLWQYIPLQQIVIKLMPNTQTVT